MNHSAEEKTGNEQVKLHVQDWGQGRPVVLIHGWPLSHEMWEHQLTELPAHGLRCIAYDRRGFGASDKPWSGYNYDTLSEDLNRLLTELDIQDAVLVGFSMGGGEVARYLSRYGAERVSRAVLIGAVTPQLGQSPTNPEGVPIEKFDQIIDGLKNDRPAFMSTFGKQFYGQGTISKAVSREVLEWTSQLALRASPKATVDCVRSFSETDFTADVRAIDVPTLVIHGDADQTVPIETTGKRAAELIPGAKLEVYEGAPHGLFMTHYDRLTKDLVEFCSQSRGRLVTESPKPDLLNKPVR